MTTDTISIDTLAIITRIIEKAQFDLSMQGYTPEQVGAAIKKSRNYAQGVSKGISPAIREMAFVDLFQSDIRNAERWLSGVRASRDSWREGLESLGTSIGPETKAAYDRWTK